MRRSACFVADCTSRAGFRFNVNEGVHPRSLVVDVCEDHLRKAMVAAMKLQEVRGDPVVSLYVMRLERPRTASAWRLPWR